MRRPRSTIHSAAALCCVALASLHASAGEDPPAAFTEVPPSSAGHLPGPGQALEPALDDLVPALLAEFSVPGAAVGVLRSGRVSYRKGFGLANREHRRPVTADTLFNAASISKAVTAWGVMRLVERGSLRLDAPVDGYLSRWHLPASPFDRSGVTLERVMSHTAGFTPGSGAGFFHEKALPTLEQTLDGLIDENAGIPTPEDILSGKVNGPAGLRMAYEPGSGERYSNAGFRLVQLVVEEVTGRPYADFMAAEVLEPLGMRGSTFEDPLKLAKDARATPYDWRGREIPVERTVGVAAGGLFTSASDLLRLAQAELGGPAGTGQRLLAPESVQRMQRPVPPSKHFGLGHVVKQVGDLKLVGHSGLGMGWNANLLMAPAEGAAIVVLTNSDNGLYVHEMVTCAWYRAALGSDSAECRSAARKRLNRLAAYLEWLVESNTLPAATARPLLEQVEAARTAVDSRSMDGGVEAMETFRRLLARLRESGTGPSSRLDELRDHAATVTSWLRAIGS